MKFRYIIVDEWGAVWGTNDHKLALKAAQVDQVVDCETGEELDDEDGREALDEFELPEDE